MPFVRRLRRRLARLARHPRTDATRKAFQACAAVRRPWRFLLAELAGGERVLEHELRRTGGRLHLRHPRIDLWAFHEIFVRSVYAPPEPVRRALAPDAGRLTIADVGAHVGMATRYFLDELAPRRIVAIEPDPSNRALLERTVGSDPRSDRVTIVPAAAATAPGRAEFVSHLHLSRLGDAGAGDGGTAIEVEVVDALPLLSGASLLKIDIQGGEWDLLEDPRFAELGARAVVLEYHADGAPSADALADARRLLGRAGLRVGEPMEVRGHEGSVWAWRDADGS